MTARRLAPAGGPAGRLRGDQGSVIIELAFVAPLLIILVLGVVEFGTVFRNQTIVTSATRQAGRVESQSSSTLTVDELAIQTFMAGTSGLRNMSLQRLVVFTAPPTGVVPPACVTAVITGTKPYGVNGTCNVYSAAQASALVADPVGNAVNFGCGGIANVTGTTWDGNWCPGARSTALVTLMTRVGVYARFTYTDVTNLFSTKTMTITSTAIFAIQPSV